MSHADPDHPRRHRLSVDGYYRMAETGILAADACVELIDGEIIDMPPSASLHAATVHRLMAIFVRAVGDSSIVLAQNPVRLTEYTEPQPDLALLRPREDFYAHHHPRAADVLLIVEIAATSLRYDRDIKGPLYAAHEIPEFWLVDLGGKRLVRHRAPQRGAYTQVDEPDLSRTLEISELAGVAVDLSRLFG